MNFKRCSRRENITADKERDHENIDKQDRERENSGRLLELPIHLLYDILSGLPIETIFSCKCVCKTFLNILADPYFAELHLKKASNVDYSLIIQDRLSALNFFLVPMVAIDGQSNCVSHPWQTLNMPSRVSPFKDKGAVYLVGSYNGLLCLHYHFDVSMFYVCNPILGEFMFLSGSKLCSYHSAGFGFCPKTKQYKVIVFDPCFRGEILTLGTNCWRRIDNVPHPLSPMSLDCCYNGNLHWIASRSPKNLICSFNLESECFSYISPPSHFVTDLPKIIIDIRIGTLGGLFCVCYLIDNDIFEVCLMKEYGVKESWTKELRVDARLSFGPGRLFLIRFLDNGDLLLFHTFCAFVYYNPRKGTRRDIWTEGFYDAIGHVPSFISLVDIAGRENVEIVGRNRL